LANNGCNGWENAVAPTQSGNAGLDAAGFDNLKVDDCSQNPAPRMETGTQLQKVMDRHGFTPWVGVGQDILAARAIIPPLLSWISFLSSTIVVFFVMSSAYQCGEP
jgi:hypothetical protein